jgi:hypothetical protein
MVLEVGEAGGKRWTGLGKLKSESADAGSVNVRLSLLARSFVEIELRPRVTCSKVQVALK